jgi:hypothetical protein
MRGSIVSLSFGQKFSRSPGEARKGAENTLENVYRNTIQELSGNITSHNVQKEVVLYNTEAFEKGNHREY